MMDAWNSRRSGLLRFPNMADARLADAMPYASVRVVCINKTLAG